MRRQLRTFVHDINQSSRAISTNVISSITNLTRRDHDRSDGTGNVFEVSLTDHLAVTGRTISIVLESCIAFLLECVTEEGLFRVPGSTSEVRRLKSGFDTGLADLCDRVSDPHAVAGTLKLYLRELPEPLLTYSLYSDWLQAAKVNDHEDRLCAMKSIISRLPKAHLDNLRYLMKFLLHLSQHTSSNKMTPQNIAMAIAPSLIWSPNNSYSTPTFDMAETNFHSLIVYNLVESASTLFPDEIILTSLAQFSQQQRCNPGITKSICDDVSGTGDNCTTNVTTRTKRVKKLAPRAPIDNYSSKKSSASPSPRFDRRLLFARNNNNYEKLSSGTSCKHLDYSSSESADADVSTVSYRLKDFDTASLDRKCIYRSRATDRNTESQLRRNSNRRSVSNVQRPNVPPPDIPKSPSKLVKQLSVDNLLVDRLPGQFNSVRLSDTTASQVSASVTVVAASGATNDAVTIDESSPNNSHSPCEPPKKPPRKSKSQSNQANVEVVDMCASDIDKNDHVPPSNVLNKLNDTQSTDEVNQLEDVSSLSNSLSSIAWTNDDDIQPGDCNSDEVNSQDEVPAPPMIPPPLPPPPSFIPSAHVAPPLPPPPAQIPSHHSPVKSNQIIGVISPAVKEKPPKPPPPPKPKDFQAFSCVERSYL